MQWALKPVFEITLQGTTFTEGTVHASKEKGEEKETLTGSEPKLLEPKRSKASQERHSRGAFLLHGQEQSRGSGEKGRGMHFQGLSWKPGRARNA